MSPPTELLRIKELFLAASELPRRHRHTERVRRLGHRQPDEVAQVDDLPRARVDGFELGRRDEGIARYRELLGRLRDMGAEWITADEVRHRLDALSR